MIILYIINWSARAAYSPTYNHSSYQKSNLKKETKALEDIEDDFKAIMDQFDGIFDDLMSNTVVAEKPIEKTNGSKANKLENENRTGMVHKDLNESEHKLHNDPVQHNYIKPVQSNHIDSVSNVYKNPKNNDYKKSVHTTYIEPAYCDNIKPVHANFIESANKKQNEFVHQNYIISVDSKINEALHNEHIKPVNNGFNKSIHKKYIESFNCNDNSPVQRNYNKSLQNDYAYLAQNSLPAPVFDGYLDPVQNEYNEPEYNSLPAPVYDDYNESVQNEYNEPEYNSLPAPIYDDYNEPVQNKYNEPEYNNFPEPVYDDYIEPVQIECNEPEYNKFPEPVYDDYIDPVQNEYNEPVQNEFNEAEYNNLPEPVYDDYNEPVQNKYNEPEYNNFPEPVYHDYIDPVQNDHSNSVHNSYNGLVNDDYILPVHDYIEPIHSDYTKHKSKDTEEYKKSNSLGQSDKVADKNSDTDRVSIESQSLNFAQNRLKILNLMSQNQPTNDVIKVPPVVPKKTIQFKTDQIEDKQDVTTDTENDGFNYVENMNITQIDDATTTQYNKQAESPQNSPLVPPIVHGYNNKKPEIVNTSYNSFCTQLPTTSSQKETNASGTKDTTITIKKYSKKMKDSQYTPYEADPASIPQYTSYYNPPEIENRNYSVQESVKPKKKKGVKKWFGWFGKSKSTKTTENITKKTYQKEDICHADEIVHNSANNNDQIDRSFVYQDNVSTKNTLDSSEESYDSFESVSSESNYQHEQIVKSEEWQNNIVRYDEEGYDLTNAQQTGDYYTP